MPPRAPNPLRHLTPALRAICDFELAHGNELAGVDERILPDGRTGVCVTLARPLDRARLVSAVPAATQAQWWENRDPHYPPEAGYLCARSGQSVVGPAARGGFRQILRWLWKCRSGSRRTRE
jgi:hypothetical protein